MKSNMMVSLVVLLTLIALAGCGSREGKILLVGVPGSEDSVFFNTDQAVEDPDSIREFKSLIEGADSLESKPQEAEREPDYVVIVNNEKASTMEISAHLWLRKDGTFVMRRGYDGNDYYTIGKADSARIKELVPLR